MAMKKRTFIYTFIAAFPVAIFFAVAVWSDLAKVDNSVPIFDLFFYLLLTPAVEEFLFRGTLQEILYKKVTSKSLFMFTYANILTSIIFAFLHIFNGSVLHTALVIIPSLIFGLLYDKTHSIMPSIIVHSVYNLNIFIIYSDELYRLLPCL